MSTTTVKPLEKITTAKEARAELDALKKERAELDEWIERHKRPHAMPQVGGPGSRRDMLAGAGSEFRRVMIEGTPEEAAQLQRDLDALPARSSQIGYRMSELRTMIAELEVAEARAAAPAKLKAALKALPSELDGLTAAREAFLEAYGRVEEQAKAIGDYRELLGDDAPALDAAEFYRLGFELSHRFRSPVTTLTNPATHASRKVGHLFQSRDEAFALARRLLPGPSKTLRQRIMALLPRGANDYNVREELTKWERHRLRLITAGEFSNAEALQPEGEE